jgi:hypothetical protein
VGFSKLKLKKLTKYLKKVKFGKISISQTFLISLIKKKLCTHTCKPFYQTSKDTKKSTPQLSMASMELLSVINAKATRTQSAYPGATLEKYWVVILQCNGKTLIILQ